MKTYQVQINIERNDIEFPVEIEIQVEEASWDQCPGTTALIAKTLSGEEVCLTEDEEEMALAQLAVGETE